MVDHHHPSTPPPPLGVPRMLIADPDDERRDLFVRVFDTEGYEIYGVSKSDRVVFEVTRLRPDVVLLDAARPESRGYELCGDLRMMDEGRLASIILVGDDDAPEEAVVRGLLCGADDYIVFPNRLEELKARLRVQLRHRRDRELLRWTRQQRSRFRNEAMVDPLTRIANRRAAEQAIEEALRGTAPLTLMMLDLDHFKQVNDEHGHIAGDDVLRRVATKLENLARRGDVVARYGGEEFLLLLTEARPQLAFTIAERFRRGLSSMVLPQVGGVTTSIGVATWDGTGEPPAVDDFIVAADEALYEAKDSGRDCVIVRHLNDPEVENLATSRLEELLVTSEPTV